jgi:predicted ATPase/DNA-binding SARP family transcriptional activator
MLLFEILGSIRARDDDRALVLGGPRQLALLAMLLVHRNQAVSPDLLIDAVWNGESDAGAVKRLQVAVARLRAALRSGSGEAPLRSAAGGYVLELDAEQLDAERFGRLVDRATAQLVDGEAEAGADLLAQALGLWRGPALADVAFADFAQPEIRRLEELHLHALEARIDADLELGRHAALIGELWDLSLRFPTRERLAAQLMLALYRDGRQTDALEVYQRTRTRLAEDIGVDPGPGLQTLQADILAQAAELTTRHLEQGILTQSVDLETGAAGSASRLPAPPNRTLGRAEEIAALVTRLREGALRLVTLTGPGGVGKTRLALETARAAESDFADGARFVSLAALERPEEVAPAIVGTLGIAPLLGELPAQSVQRFLSAKHMLLVMDNFEHLLAGAGFMAELLAGCPRVAVLATSREPLALRAEERYPVAPLALPDLDICEGTDALGGVAAVALFAERARAQDGAFALGDGNASAVVEICRRVDGLPLAIELAAARCGLLSPGEIALRLDAVLGALATGPRDAPARQRTLRATIDWSHDLLGENEQAAFARFAVFAGGATVTAVETITEADLDTLGRLVAKSLLVREHNPTASSRLRMLETVRAYASERFAAADHEDVRERHYRFFLALAERHGADRALWGRDSTEHLARLDAESDNIHGALRWAFDQSDARSALAMCAAMGYYWELRDRNADAMEWVQRALSLPGAEAHPVLRVRVLCHQTWFLWRLGRVHDAPPVMADAEATARTLAIPTLLAHTLATRSWREAAAGRTDTAETLAEEALHWATVSGEEWAIAEAIHVKAPLASTLAELRERVDGAEALLKGVGNVYQLVNLLGTAAYSAIRLGGDQDALELITRAASTAGDTDDASTQMFISGNTGLAALLTGDTDTAQDAFRAELRLCHELVVPAFAAEGLLGLAAIAADRGNVQRAARLSGAAITHGHDLTDPDIRARLAASFFDPARTRERADAWDANVREGAALSFDEAIAYALHPPASSR